MNRIEKKFKELKEKKKKAFIAFVTAGFPDLGVTEKLIPALAKAGADVIELGVPFSDPLADGPTIQAASQKALAKHVTLDKILHTVRRIRKKTDVPLALMTYYNPVFHYGDERFAQNASRAGVDGLIIPDLPPEEAKELIRPAHRHGLATVFFVSPTTRKDRMKKIVRASTGFIYYVSITGVTGARKTFAPELLKKLREVKRSTSKPVCVGFGVSTPAQVRSIARLADGVIVGSAIIKVIAQSKNKKAIIPRVQRFVESLTRALP